MIMIYRRAAEVYKPTLPHRSQDRSVRLRLNTNRSCNGDFTLAWCIGLRLYNRQLREGWCPVQNLQRRGGASACIQNCIDVVGEVANGWVNCSFRFVAPNCLKRCSRPQTKQRHSMQPAIILLTMKGNVAFAHAGKYPDENYVSEHHRFPLYSFSSVFHLLYLLHHLYLLSRG